VAVRGACPGLALGGRGAVVVPNASRGTEQLFCGPASLPGRCRSARTPRRGNLPRQSGSGENSVETRRQTSAASCSRLHPQTIGPSEGAALVAGQIGVDARFRSHTWRQMHTDRSGRAGAATHAQTSARRLDQAALRPCRAFARPPPWLIGRRAADRRSAQDCDTTGPRSSSFERADATLERDATGQFNAGQPRGLRFLTEVLGRPLW